VADDLVKRVQRTFEGTDELEEKLKNALLEIARDINELRVYAGAAQAHDTSQSADMDVRGVDQSES
jgi:phage shock protein A